MSKKQLMKLKKDELADKILAAYKLYDKMVEKVARFDEIKDIVMTKKKVAVAHCVFCGSINDLEVVKQKKFVCAKCMAELNAAEDINSEGGE